MKQSVVVAQCVVILCVNVLLGQNPLTDSSNADGWILNTTISDEFNGSELDKTKWWILGENGDYRSKWKGRAPGQYAPHNVTVQGGELVLSSQWEPTFNFVNEQHNGTYYGGTATSADNSKPITQAAVISETFFKYGYMEIRAKLADAPVVSAFWTTGYHSEIDMIEIMGKLPIGNPENRPADLTRRYRTNMINWDPDIPSSHENWKVEDDMGVNLAEDYHVYGFEWDRDYIRTYLDGVMVRSATRTELEANNQWRHDAPQELWFDNEVFSWYGLPSQADLAMPAEFKIDYVRIWQKEITPPNFNALGFEGPFYFQGRSRSWWNPPSAQWRIKNEKPASGDFSLRFQHSGTFSGNYTTFSPNGSLNLPAGSNEVKFKIWIGPSTTVSEIDMILQNPWKVLTFDLNGVQKGEWVEVSQTFTRNTASNTSLTSGDRIRFRLQSADIIGSQALFYVDDIFFNNNTLSVDDTDTFDFSIYPNPTKESIKISSAEMGILSIYSVTGVKVKTINKESQTIEVRVDELPSGIYMVKFVSGTKEETKKLIINYK
ncbi:T9SS type A sorting domain-containing protein [uncultured Aquimarina sp.]|uniref:T9SS type A sorting domain-containing protein n=1 Tax=uncultured Aquimarina sp. TaxID=575652 RepID=UPI0026031779|nr:T9SS type A sorting domain-containing protein [uncultured Aquimarina sp.]